MANFKKKNICEVLKIVRRHMSLAAILSKAAEKIFLFVLYTL